MLTEHTMVGRFEAHVTPDGATTYFDPGHHRYYGEIKPNPKSEGGYSYVQASALVGVSTAAKYLDGDPTGLMHWAAHRDQEGIAEIATADLDAGRSLDWLRSQGSIAARLSEAEATWVHIRDRRAEEGTNVHKKAVWALATGQERPSLADLSEAERGFGQGTFSWFHKRQPRPVAAEQLTVSQDKRIAGTFDLLADVDVDKFDTVPEHLQDRDTIRILLDAKTRDEPRKIRKSDHVQLQGYEDCNQTCGIGSSDAQIVLLLLPDGTFREYWCDATVDEWYAALNSCHASKQVERRMAQSKREADKAREAVAA